VIAKLEAFSLSDDAIEMRTSTTEVALDRDARADVLGALSADTPIDDAAVFALNTKPSIIIHADAR